MPVRAYDGYEFKVDSIPATLEHRWPADSIIHILGVTNDARLAWENQVPRG